MRAKGKAGGKRREEEEVDREIGKKEAARKREPRGRLCFSRFPLRLAGIMYREERLLSTRYCCERGVFFICRGVSS